MDTVVTMKLKITLQHLARLKVNEEKTHSDKVTLSETKINVNAVKIEMQNNNMKANNLRIRGKRQSSESKFTEASKMPQIKQLRLFLQMFKNFYDKAYIGGRHPLHHNVPKTFVTLFKQKIVEFFVPDVGEDKEMAV